MFKGDITDLMEDNGFQFSKTGGIHFFERGDDEVGFIWWSNEKIAKKENTYKAHLGVVLPSGRYRLPLTKFVPVESGDGLVEVKREWSEIAPELQLFLDSLTDDSAKAELESNSRYDFWAEAPELEK